MSEASGLAKIVLVLGVFAFLIAALYPAQNTGWAGFSSTASSFPSFNNPFTSAGSIITETRTVGSNGDSQPGSLEEPVGVAGCDEADWYKCVQSNDGNESYIISNYTKVGFAVQFDNSSYSYDIITDVIVTISCSTNNTSSDLNSASFFIGVNETTFVPAGGAESLRDLSQRCPAYPSFGNVRIAMPQVPGFGLYWHEVSGLNISVNWEIMILAAGTIDYSGDEMYVSFVQVDVLFETTPPCTGNWFESAACQIGRFIDIIWKGILFAVNGIIFIGSVMVWLVQMAVSFFGIIGSSMSLPGVPADIQTIINVILIALIIMLVIAVFRIVRGSGSTG
jgi:hypothetical protein